MGQACFGQAHEFVTMDAAVVLQAFLGSRRHLGRQTFVGGVDWRTNHGGEARVDENLSADKDEHAELFRVPAGGLLDPVQFTAPHNGTW